MNPLNPTTRFAGLAAAVAAVAAAVGGVIQLTHDFGDSTKVVGTAAHLNLVTFSVMLLAIVPVTAWISRQSAGDARPAVFTAVAATALAILGTISNVKGDDPSFFPMVAAPSLLTIFASWIVIAVRGSKAKRMPKALMVGLPLVLVVSIPLSQFGGGILAGAYWAAIAVYALRGERRGAKAPVPAVA